MALLQWSGLWVQGEKQREKKEKEGYRENMIKQKYKTFCNAVEFDKFGKLYNLTPETGLSKAVQRETDCVYAWEKESVSVWDRLTWRGVGHEERIVITLGIVRTVTSSNKPAWPYCGKRPTSELLLYCRWEESVQTAKCQTAAAYQHSCDSENFLNQLFNSHVD